MRALFAAAVLFAAAASPALARPQLEPSRGLIAAVVVDGSTTDAVTGAMARRTEVYPFEGHDGRKRAALRFDGVRSYLDLGEQLSPERFTVSAWIRPESLDRPQVIVSKLRDAARHNWRNFELRINPGGRLFVHVPGGQSWDGVEGMRVLVPGRWVHVAATYDGARAQLWIDGERDGRPLAVEYAQSRAPIWIGARPDPGEGRGKAAFFFRGAMEDVRIYDRALSDPEMQLLAGRPVPPPPPPPPPATGGADELLSRWPLDGDARDTAGNAHGKLLGGGLRAAEDRRGNAQGALAFDGKGWVDLGGGRSEPERFTLTAWVRASRVDADEQVVLSKYSSAAAPWDRYLELRVERGGRLALVLPSGDGRGDALRTSAALAPGRWTFVAATFDGERAALYLDGALDAERRLPSFDASRGPLFLGARPQRDGDDARPWSAFAGRLDDVQLFKGALSPAEVASVFQTGEAHPRPPPPPPRPAPGGDDDDDGKFLVRVDRLLSRWDLAAARGDGRALGELEERILAELADAEDAARDEKEVRIAGFLRRAAEELRAVRGRRDGVAIDRTRLALARLSEALWGELVKDLGADDFREGRGPRGGKGRWY